MRIRPAGVSEASTLSALALAAKRHWRYGPEDIERWRPLLTVTESELVSRPAFVADVGGEAAGFYVLEPRQAVWELEHLWVSPQYMRRGIGRALLEHAAGTARAGGASEILIDADPNAEAFYLACGATRLGAVAAPITSDRARVRPQLSLHVLNSAR